jgi:hypothetical protein
MPSLEKSPRDEQRYRGHELQSCPECHGEKFRAEDDTFGSRGEKFKVYRDEHGAFWRTACIPAEVVEPVLSPIVCCTCEERALERDHPSRRPESLVVYDGTGKQIPPALRKSEGRWV